jgi:hypothetical protein
MFAELNNRKKISNVVGLPFPPTQALTQLYLPRPAIPFNVAGSQLSLSFIPFPSLERAGAQCAPYNYVSEEKVRKKT